MADQSGAQWLDLLEEDIPVVDKSGKQLLVKGIDFVDAPTAAPAADAPSPSAPSVAPVAAVPAPAPVAIVVGVQSAAQKPLEAQPTSTRGDFGLDPDKDAADLKKIEALMKARAAEPEKKSDITQLDAIIDAAVAETGTAFADEDMRRRYRTLVSLYFRDLRDMLETKSKFTMPVQSGGMGMSDADADAAMDKLRVKNSDYHAAMSGKATEDKAKYVADRTETIIGAQEKSDKADTEKREQAFSGLLERSGMAATPVQSAALPSPVPQVAKDPKVVPVVGLDSKGIPMTPAAPVVAAAVTPTIAPAPASAAAVPTTAQPAAVPGMADVKFTPKLTGPVEELRSLLLKDFRRLSRDPNEATLKLKDKIDLLEEQSFDVKTQGIKAWQESEVNKLYLDILRKSLEGKPVTDVMTEREAKGELTLNKAEFDAIMELNRKLRFG